MTVPVFKASSRYREICKGTLDSIAEHVLSGEDYGRGALEELEATVHNQSQAIGRLLEHLLEKGHIHQSQIVKVLDIDNGEGQLEKVGVRDA